MKYIVRACCIDRASEKILDVRNEEIDIEKNDLFKGCNSLFDIENRYEDFWNRLNDNYENKHIIKVLNVKGV